LRVTDLHSQLVNAAVDLAMAGLEVLDPTTAPVGGRRSLVAPIICRARRPRPVSGDTDPCRQPSGPVAQLHLA
jgi:hypothetical protein